MQNARTLAGIWSATPTPFTDGMEVDVPAVGRLVEHHVRLGVKGLFLAGTCGEGPWMTDRQKRALVRATVDAARGRLAVAVQVTDNSAARIRDNMDRVREDGADFAVIAPPYFLLNATPANVLQLYRDAIRNSPLPVGIYDRGAAGAVPVPDEILGAMYAEPKVVLVKDSSRSPSRRAIASEARSRRPELLVLSGDEFTCVEYLKAAYDGLLLGGGIFNGHVAGRIRAAVLAGDLAAAERLQTHMIEMMHAVYGGPQIRCWLAGLKTLLVRMGIFGTARHYLGYPLTPECDQAIDRLLEEDRDLLFP